MPENNRTRILVVEDDALIGLVFEQFLRDYGYSVIGPIENLKAAEFLAATEEIDAAVSSTLIFPEKPRRRLPINSSHAKFHFYLSVGTIVCWACDMRLYRFCLNHFHPRS